SVCMRAYEATTTTMAYAGTLAHSTASFIGRWTVRLNGSTGGAVSRAVTRGSSSPTSSTASRKRVLVLRRVHVGECLPEGLALHRGSEYNRRTGCGKTARPGLDGGCRVTGIPTVEAPETFDGRVAQRRCRSGHSTKWPQRSAYMPELPSGTLTVLHTEI